MRVHVDSLAIATVKQSPSQRFTRVQAIHLVLLRDEDRPCTPVHALVPCVAPCTSLSSTKLHYNLDIRSVAPRPSHILSRTPSPDPRVLALVAVSLSLQSWSWNWSRGCKIVSEQEWRDIVTNSSENSPQFFFSCFRMSSSSSVCCSSTTSVVQALACGSLSLFALLMFVAWKMGGEDVPAARTRDSDILADA